MILNYIFGSSNEFYTFVIIILALVIGYQCLVIDDYKKKDK